MPVTNYTWDGENILFEADDSGDVTAEYTYEPRKYGDLVGGVHSGESYTYYFDVLGSTIALTDTTGNIANTFSYNAWGEECTRTGGVETSFRWIGASGYSFEPDVDVIYVRARMYSSGLARWQSRDPLYFIERALPLSTPIEDVAMPFGYVLNSPLTATDPSGLLSIIPAGQQLDGLRCGGAAFISWDFRIDYTDPTTKTMGAPCDGFLVQMVTVACNVRRCAAERRPDELTYWEAWRVRKGERWAMAPDRANGITDTAGFVTSNMTRGYYRQDGEVRFYCRSKADDPGNNPGTGPIEKSWIKGPLNRGRCMTTAGTAIRTTERPKFWKEPAQAVDGPATRWFYLTWDCCPCFGVSADSSVYATGSPRSN